MIRAIYIIAFTKEKSSSLSYLQRMVVTKALTLVKLVLHKNSPNKDGTTSTTMKLSPFCEKYLSLQVEAKLDRVFR